MRVVEKMRGEGVVPERGAIQKVTYDLRVMQNEIDVGPGEPPLPGLKTIVGTILPVGTIGDLNTLVMSDGRKFKFYCHHSDGSITSSGPIE